MLYVNKVLPTCLLFEKMLISLFAVYNSIVSAVLSLAVIFLLGIAASKLEYYLRKN